MNEVLEMTIIFTPFIINISLYYYWKYRAKKAMARDNIDYWIESYDICEFSMFMFGLLWLPGTVFMILSLKFDRGY
jgi:hypothetical protein